MGTQLRAFGTSALPWDAGWGRHLTGHVRKRLFPLVGRRAPRGGRIGGMVGVPRPNLRQRRHRRCGGHLRLYSCADRRDVRCRVVVSRDVAARCRREFGRSGNHPATECRAIHRDIGVTIPTAADVA
jgi:hypothetical protein